jgi:hypothetical protein
VLRFRHCVISYSIKQKYLRNLNIFATYITTSQFRILNKVALFRTHTILLISNVGNGTYIVGVAPSDVETVPRFVITALHSKVNREYSQPIGGQKDVAVAFIVICIIPSFVTMC